MTDERDLDDSALAAAWRAQSAEAPPAALDDAILAAAHRAVKSAPAKISPGSEATRPWRWWAPLAAAATIGVIAIGVLQLMPHEHDDTTAVISDMPAASSAPVDAIKDRKAEVARDSESAPVAPPPPVAQTAPAFSPQPLPARRNAAAAKPAAPRVEPASEAAAPLPERNDTESEAVGMVGAPRQAAPALATQNAPQASRAGAVESSPRLSKRTLGDGASAATPGTPSTPEEWIARIRALMAAGDMAEANRAMTAFRAAYRDADARLPADLRPWATTVPR